MTTSIFAGNADVLMQQLAKAAAFSSIGAGLLLLLSWAIAAGLMRRTR